MNFLYVILCVILISTVEGSSGVSRTVPVKRTEFKDKHLRVILFHLHPALSVTRNSTGHVVHVTGPIRFVMDWLTRSLHFKYEFLEDNLRGIEDGPGYKGMLSYLLEGKAEMILGITALTAERIKKMDFPYPCVMSGFVLLIPMFQPSTNLAAVLQPFQQLVWIFVLVSTFVTIVALWCFGRVLVYVEKKVGLANKNDTSRGFVTMDQSFQYVVSMLLSQGLQINSGQLFRQRKVSVRCLAGAWCVTVFLLVTAYCSVLTSFITSPNYKPLINSIEDLPKKSDVKLIAVRGRSPDVLFMNSESGIGKFVGDQLRRQPELRCNQQSDCVETVRQGPNFVYSSVPNAILNIIGEDLKAKGRCDFSMAKESYWPISSGISLSKNISDMLEAININIMKMHEAGLIDMWMLKSLTDPSRCLNPPDISSTPRLTLSGLSGPFVILVAGTLVSIILFIGENLLGWFFSEQSTKSL